MRDCYYDDIGNGIGFGGGGGGGTRVVSSGGRNAHVGDGVVEGRRARVGEYLGNRNCVADPEIAASTPLNRTAEIAHYCRHVMIIALTTRCTCSLSRGGAAPEVGCSYFAYLDYQTVDHVSSRGRRGGD